MTKNLEVLKIELFLVTDEKNQTYYQKVIKLFSVFTMPKIRDPYEIRNHGYQDLKKGSLKDRFISR